MEAWVKGRSKILKIIRLRRNGVGVGGTQVTSKLQTLTLPIFVKKKKKLNPAVPSSSSPSLLQRE